MKEDEKSQSKSSETSDEIEAQVMQKAEHTALCCVAGVTMILLSAKLIINESGYDANSIIFIIIGVLRLYRGVKLHEKNEIIFGVIFCIISLIFLFLYLFRILT